MNLLKPAIASAAMLFGGVAASTPDNADAGVRVSIGNYGYGNAYRGYRGYGNDYGYRSNYGYRNYGYSGFGWGGGFDRGHYGHGHSQGHYDYHPTTVVPHGNHYDVIPGHYDYHYTGHGRHGH